MSRFCKRFASLIAIIIVAIIIFAVVAWFRLPAIAAHILSSKLGVAVHIEDIDITKENISIDEFEISNPIGSKLPKAFFSKLISIDAPLGNYLDNDVIVDQIAVDNIYVSLEFSSSGSPDGNWTRIMNNLKEGEAPKSEKKKGGKTVLIKRLVLTDLKIDLVQNGKVRNLPQIDRLTFTDISSEGGFPINQIINAVLTEMLFSIFKENNLQNMLENVLQLPEVPLKGLKKPFGNLFNANYTPSDERENAA